MKRIILIALISLFFTACVSSPMQSLIFTSTTQTTNGDVVGNTISSAKILKSGKSCSMSGFPISLFFYGTGNSIEEAKQNAGIQKVALIDRDSLTVPFFLFYRECVIVWGE